MTKHSKRFRTLQAKVTPGDAMPLDSALSLLKEFGTTKFDQTVEIHMRLGIDPKQADQIVRTMANELLDDPLDVVGGHVRRFGRGHRRPQTRVAGRVAPTLPRRGAHAPPYPASHRAARGRAMSRTAPPGGGG